MHEGQVRDEVDVGRCIDLGVRLHGHVSVSVSVRETLLVSRVTEKVYHWVLESDYPRPSQC